jgi:hypothetical protein
VLGNLLGITSPLSKADTDSRPRNIGKRYNGKATSIRAMSLVLNRIPRPGLRALNPQNPKFPKGRYGAGRDIGSAPGLAPQQPLTQGAHAPST